jgi:hypothetical protein
MDDRVEVRFSEREGHHGEQRTSSPAGQLGVALARRGQ